MNPPSTPVVLLHGCGGTAYATFESTDWLSAIESSGRRALAPDLPGHGPRKASHDPAAYGDLAGEVLRGLPTGRLAVVGFSLGAKLALEIALREPERINCLVLGGIGDNVFAPEAIAPIAARGLECPESPEAAHPAVSAMLKVWDGSRNDAKAVAALLRRPANPIFTQDRLRSITAPTLIINGADDPVGQRSAALVDCLRNARRETLPGVDHFGLPQQQQFRQLALTFLNLETHG